jgi:arylsulfatase A-like enzyme
MPYTPADREPLDLPQESGADPQPQPDGGRESGARGGGGELRSDRRSFIKQGLVAGGALLLGAGGTSGAAGAARSHKRAAQHRAGAPRHRPPNILVILVDQLRAPVWLPAGVSHAAIMPALASLRAGAVNFERHYTASNDCSPSRGALVTGLYSHQTGCLITGNSRLDPGFPTWGTFLRERGYRTSWWGKWHLNPDPNAPLGQYGFGGGTYPSPNGAPGQGTEADPGIVAQFAEWFRQDGGGEPWCSTVSLVNPHDIAWWYRFTSRIAQESAPPALASALPPNFETPEAHEAQRKPRRRVRSQTL